MTNMTRSIPVVLALILVAILRPPSVYAGTQAEYQALQQWCVGRDKWTAEGRKTDYPNPPEYFHFHHYCAAMNAMNRLYATLDPIKQRYEASLVGGETGYVISHVPENHFLVPELYALRGRAQSLIKQTPQAEASLLKALQLDPRHVIAYLSLGNLYLETNRKAKAVEATKTGLAIDPQNKPLRRLAAKLDIKLVEAKPESVQPKSATTSGDQPQQGVGAEPVQGGAKPTASATPSTPLAPEPVKQIVTEASIKASEKTGNAETATPNGGPSKNPWCRFCPDAPAATAAPAASTPPTTPKAGQ
jgi:tetratricopeptide (TPR) repeat protein